MADIGQNVNEKVTMVTAGANLGWNIWEGGLTYNTREVGTAKARSDAEVTYPIVEYDHTDPLFQRNVAVTGVYAYRGTAIKQLTNKLLFGDNPSGEIFYVDADNLPQGGQDAIRRILFDEKGEKKTLLELMKEKNAAQNRTQAARVADMRMDVAQGKIFILNKGDGTIRVLVP